MMIMSCFRDVFNLNRTVLIFPTGYSSSGSTPHSPSKEPKEAEVDALTHLLMQNMEAAADPDFFGKSPLSSK